MLKSKYTTGFVILGVAVLSFCQLTSYLVETYLPQEQTKVLTSYLHFSHVRNMGGIFGLAQGHGWVFASVSAIFIVGLVMWVLKSNYIRPFEYIFYALIVGGGCSNILDRLIYGSVIDFIAVKGIPHWNYIFNTADVMIHLGVWPMIISSFFPLNRSELNDNGASETPSSQST